MDWIRINTGLNRHHKVAKLARRLKVSRHEALGLIVELFCWTGQVKESGELNGMDPEDLAIGCCWEGDPDTFVAALVSCGLLDVTEAGHKVHDWLEYQGYVFHQRERRRDWRDRQRVDSESTLSRPKVDRESSDVRTYVRTEKNPRARTRERDRSPAEAGAVARTYREWEPPSTALPTAPVDTSRMAATLARRADEAEAAGRTAEAAKLREQIAKYLTPAPTPEEAPA